MSDDSLDFLDSMGEGTPTEEHVCEMPCSNGQGCCGKKAAGKLKFSWYCQEHLEFMKRIIVKLRKYRKQAQVGKTAWETTEEQEWEE